MLNTISLGTYFPGNSLLHRLQSRTKLLALLWIVVTMTIANQRIWHFVPFVVIVLLVGLAIACSSIRPGDIWRRIWLLVVLILLSAIPALFTFSDKQDKPLYTYGPLHTSDGAVRQLLVPIFIVLLLFLLSSWLPPTRRLRHYRWFTWVRALPLLLAIVIAAFLLVTLALADKTPLVVGPLVITQSGVWFQASVFLALLVLYVLSLLLTMTTSPVALIEGLTMLLSPLRRFRLPVDDFSLMTLIALRFIPTLLEEVQLLMKAQAARGADVASGTMRERIQSLTMLFVPLMNSVLRRASELAIALEARGYEVEGQQTMLHERSFAALDYVVLAVVVVLTTASLFF